MKKLIIRILILLSLILLLQMSLTYYNFQFESPDPIRKLDKYLNNNIDIIYFGDSTIKWSSAKDKNKQSISEMLDILLPSFLVKSVDHNAYHMDLYYQYVKFISNRKHPKLVIIPINMATFSPTIDKRPSYQFETVKIFLEYYDNYLFRIFYKPLLTFKAFDINAISNNEFLNTKVYNGEKAIGTVKDIEFEIKNQPLKNIVIYNYMYSLKKDHRKIKSMLEIVQLAKKNNIKLLFYFTPLNYQVCEKHMGDEFRQRIKTNTNLIKSLLSENGIDVLDITFDLPTISFCWIDDGCLNEHLTETGRKHIAQNLSKWISDNLTK